MFSTNCRIKFLVVLQIIVCLFAQNFHELKLFIACKKKIFVSICDKLLYSCSLTGDLTSSACVHVCGCVVDDVSATTAT